MIAVPDANVLLRIVEINSKHHGVALAAVAELISQGFALHTVPQCFYEFWVVATRPKANNGLGLSTADAAREMATLLDPFPVIDDTPDLFAEWRALVVAHDCKGKVAHDARIVAAMNTHRIQHLLTFNVADFARFPGIVVLDPHAVAAPAP